MARFLHVRFPRFGGVLLSATEGAFVPGLLHHVHVWSVRPKVRAIPSGQHNSLLLLHGTARTRQKLFVPGTGALVNISTPLTLMVLVC